MAKLTRVGVIFLSMLFAAIMAATGFIAGILYSIGGMDYDFSTVGLNNGTALTFLAIIGMPFIFSIAGLAAGAMGAVLYNLLAGWFGGIELDIERSEA